MVRHTLRKTRLGGHFSGRVSIQPLLSDTEDEYLTTPIALDVPKDEARFLTKLDLTLISSSALGVMCRYLDQVNITNAFSMLADKDNKAEFFC